MERNEIISTINKELAEEFEKDPQTFALDKNMKETLGLDSLDLVDLIVVIEQDFGIKLKNEDFASIKTFDDFYTLLDNRINN